MASTVSASARVEISNHCCAPGRDAARGVLPGASGPGSERPARVGCVSSAISYSVLHRASDTEGVLDLLEEALVLMGFDVSAEGLGQAFQQLALLVGNVGRGDDVQAHL